MTAHNIAARLLAHTICPDFDSIEKDKYGKPYFESQNHPISITHAGKYAAFIYTTDRQCGIDIEHVTNRIDRIKHKFIREDETPFLQHHLQGMYLVWCAKESMYKFHGVKALDFKQHMRLNYTSISQYGKLVGSIQKGDYQKSIPLHYQFFDEYLLVHTL